MIRAEYDSRADALAIDLVANPIAASGEGVDDRCTVALDGQGRAISVELLSPRDGLETSLDAAADRYGLDAEALIAAARSALAAPDREISGGRRPDARVRAESLARPVEASDPEDD